MDKTQENLPHLDTYRVQKACYNCKYVFDRHEYDEPPRYYCTYGSEKRPKCGSLWWSEKRYVLEFGICDLYEEQDDETSN